MLRLKHSKPSIYLILNIYCFDSVYWSMLTSLSTLECVKRLHSTDLFIVCQKGYEEYDSLVRTCKWLFHWKNLLLSTVGLCGV